MAEPVHLDVTNTIEEVRAKYDGKLEAGQETEDMVGTPAACASAWASHGPWW